MWDGNVYFFEVVFVCFVYLYEVVGCSGIRGFIERIVWYVFIL